MFVELQGQKRAQTSNCETNINKYMVYYFQLVGFTTVIPTEQ